MIVSRAEAVPKTPDDLLGPQLAAALNRLDVLSARCSPENCPENAAPSAAAAASSSTISASTFQGRLHSIDWNVLARLDKLFIKIFPTRSTVTPPLRGCFRLHGCGPAQQALLRRPCCHGGGVRGARKPEPRRDDGLPRVRQAREAARTGPRQEQREAALATAAPESLEPSAAVGVPDQDSARRAPARTDFNAALRGAAMSRSGKGVMVVLSDFLNRDGCEPGLNYLYGGGVTGFKSLGPPPAIAGRDRPETERSRGLIGDLRLTDSESGAAQEVTISPALIDKYRDRFGPVHRALEDRLPRGIAYVRVPTDTRDRVRAGFAPPRRNAAIAGSAAFRTGSGKSRYGAETKSVTIE